MNEINESLEMMKSLGLKNDYIIRAINNLANEMGITNFEIVIQDGEVVIIWH